jgi:hypothetical protein
LLFLHRLKQEFDELVSKEADLARRQSHESDRPITAQPAQGDKRESENFCGIALAVSTTQIKPMGRRDTGVKRRKIRFPTHS